MSDECTLEQNQSDELIMALEKYNELIMAVSNKYPDETRHETALRYIRERNHELGASQKAVKAVFKNSFICVRVLVI